MKFIIRSALADRHVTSLHRRAEVIMARSSIPSLVSLTLLTLSISPPAAAAPVVPPASTSEPEVDRGWQVYLDTDVIVTTRSGSAYVGHLVGLDAKGLTMQIAGGSTNLVVAFDDVTEIRARTSAPPPPPAPPGPPGPQDWDPPHQPSNSPDEPASGRGLLVAGYTIMGVGLALSLVGTTLWRVCDFDGREACYDTGVGMFYLGLPHIVTGIPMVAVGSARMKKWKEWKRKGVTVRPTMRMTENAWSVGLRLQF